jgi:hypothetical protein
MEWMHTLLYSQAFSTARSIICALWPLQLLGLFFACCELAWFTLKLKRTWSGSNSSFAGSGSGISSGIDHNSIAVARLIAGNGLALTIDEVCDGLGGNAHQRRKIRRRISRVRSRREIL